MQPTPTAGNKQPPQRPKGVVRDNGGHAVALQWSMRNIYGVQPGETFWAASDIGWVVGHSYIVYGPLLNGNTTILYELYIIAVYRKVVVADRTDAIFVIDE